jgi:hypothetical protein
MISRYRGARRIRVLNNEKVEIMSLTQAPAFWLCRDSSNRRWLGYEIVNNLLSGFVGRILPLLPNRWFGGRARLLPSRGSPGGSPYRSCRNIVSQGISVAVSRCARFRQRLAEVLERLDFYGLFEVFHLRIQMGKPASNSQEKCTA